MFIKKYALKIHIPDSIKIEYLDEKATIIGDKDAIYNFIKELRKISELNDGQLCELDKLTLKISDSVTDDRFQKFWIEMPDHAWSIMASKFYDAWEGYDENPLYFNECGYLSPKNPYDLGIEIIDMPIQFMEHQEDGTFITKIIERK